MDKIFKCCEYTLGKVCKKCGKKTLSVRPLKFRLEDKYIKQRIKAKKEIGYYV